MRFTCRLSSIALLALYASASAYGQLMAASEGPIVYGHHHLNVSDLDAHKRFWVDTLGGTATTFGTTDVVKFPNVLVFLREQAPTGGTKGTTVNHIGFSVPDLSAVLGAARAAGFPVVTREELPPAMEVSDGIAHVANQGVSIAFLMAPDDVKVEIVEIRSQDVPITLHHVHFAAQDVHEMRDWYADTFGAVPGTRGSFQTANLPGVDLSYVPSEAPLQGLQGRSLDHIGFEVDGLEAFCRDLEASGIVFDRPYTEIEARGISLAFFTDPWGTYIELTEGLDSL